MLRIFFAIIFLTGFLSLSSLAMSQVNGDIACPGITKLWSPNEAEVQNLADTPIPDSYYKLHETPERPHCAFTVLGLLNWHLLNGTEATSLAALNFLHHPPEEYELKISSFGEYRSQVDSADWLAEIEAVREIIDPIPKDWPLNLDDYDREKYTREEVLKYRQAAGWAASALSKLWFSLEYDLDAIETELDLAELHDSEKLLSLAENNLSQLLKNLSELNNYSFEVLERLTEHEIIPNKLVNIEPITWRRTILQTRIALLKAHQGDAKAMKEAASLLEEAHHPAFDTHKGYVGFDPLYFNCRTAHSGLFETRWSKGEGAKRMLHTEDFCGWDLSLPLARMEYYGLKHRYEILNSDDYFDLLQDDFFYLVPATEFLFNHDEDFPEKIPTPYLYRSINTLWLGERILTQYREQQADPDKNPDWDTRAITAAMKHISMEDWPSLWRKLARQYLQFESYSEKEFRFEDMLKRQAINAQIDTHDKLFPFDKIKPSPKP